MSSFDMMLYEVLTGLRCQPSLSDVHFNEIVIGIRSEHGLDLVFEAERVVRRLEVVHYLAVLIDQELGEVPGNDLCLVRAGVVHRTLGSAEAVHGVRAGSVHLDLGEHGEGDVVGALGPGFDLSLRARLLLLELVARECKDLKSLLAILIVESHHLTIVHVRQTSLGRDIDHHDALLALQDLAQVLNLPPVDVLCANLEQALRRVRKSLTAALLDAGKD